MSEPSETAVSEFVDWTTKLRCSSVVNEAERIYLGSAKRSLYMHLTEAAKREKIIEAQVTRALMYGATGGDGAGPSRAELEAKVRDLELKVAALEGKVSVLQEDRDTIREKLFAMLGAGTKQ